MARKLHTLLLHCQKLHFPVSDFLLLKKKIFPQRENLGRVTFRNIYKSSIIMERRSVTAGSY